MIPKSLHTVTVLVNVAREHVRNAGLSYTSAPLCYQVAVRHALKVLGYADTPDAYGLAARAVAILEKEQRK
jgi:hypothetical protein